MSITVIIDRFEKLVCSKFCACIYSLSWFLANSLFFPPVSIHFLADLFSLLHLITPASDCAGGTFSTRP